VTEHQTSTGKVYCCAVLDVFSRVVVGWSIADHMRTELVVDALQMATLAAAPKLARSSTRLRSSLHQLGFRSRLRAAGLLGSTGRVASSVDNSMMESFWSTIQRELLDRQWWNSPQQLATAILEWIEAWYNTHRRRTSLDMFPRSNTKPFTPPRYARHDHHTTPCPENRVRAPTKRGVSWNAPIRRRRRPDATGSLSGRGRSAPMSSTRTGRRGSRSQESPYGGSTRTWRGGVSRCAVSIRVSGSRRPGVRRRGGVSRRSRRKRVRRVGRIGRGSRTGCG
jgi:Integrase core domain